MIHISYLSYYEKKQQMKTIPFSSHAQCVRESVLSVIVSFKYRKKEGV